MIFQLLQVAGTYFWRRNIARVRNCPDVPISNSLFGLCLVVVFVVVVFVVIVFFVVVFVVIVFVVVIFEIFVFVVTVVSKVTLCVKIQKWHPVTH